MYFKNTKNGYIERSRYPWLWCLLFGPLYLLHKGAVAWTLIYLIAAAATFSLSIYIFPFFAHKIVRNAYLKQGWVEVDDDQ